MSETEIKAKFLLPINAMTNSRLSSGCGIAFGRYGPVWDRFVETGQGFGVGIRDSEGDTGRIFGLVSSVLEEPVVLLTEEAIGVLWRIAGDYDSQEPGDI